MTRRRYIPENGPKTSQGIKIKVRKVQEGVALKEKNLQTKNRRGVVFDPSSYGT